MENEEIKELIEMEKREMKAFLRIAEKYDLPPEVVAIKINFYLDKILELQRQLNE